MFTHDHQIRIRYSETDQMGYCYYGNYAAFFEIGRVETLRALGISYKSLEQSGIMLPVTEFYVKYLKPAVYDDLITIRTKLIKTPSVKIEFEYELFNDKGQLLTEAKTTLVFIQSENMKPCPAPKDLLNKLKEKIEIS